MDTTAVASTSSSTTIAPWGNSEALRIPRDLLRRVGLRQGDHVTFKVNDEGHLEILPEKDCHRRVEPLRGVTFDMLFKNYEPEVVSSSSAWPSDDMAGVEWDAWSH